MNNFKIKWDRIRKNIIDNGEQENHIFISQDIGEKMAKQFSKINVNELQLLNDVLSKNCNLYEMILPNRLIKPFFVLEMDGCYNNVDKLNLFISLVGYEISKVFNIILELTDFAILTSCIEGKLLYHIIITQKIYFNNIIDCGLFVKYLQYRINNPASTDEKLLFDEFIWLSSKETKYIFDSSVYSNYQQIKLVNQSKRGKSIILTQFEPELYDINDYWISLLDIEDRELLNVDLINHEQKQQTRVQSVNDSVKFTDKRPVYIDWSSNFNIEGSTLCIKYNLTFDILLTFPPWKRYLYLIVNYKSTNEQRINVGMALANETATENDWIDWVKLNPEYKNDDTKRFNTFKSKGIIKSKFDINMLKKLARICNPDFFKQKAELFCDYFQVDLTGITVINETSKYLSQSGTPDEYNIFTDDKFLIKFAGCGKGKTTSINRMLIHYDVKTYLFISPRITFASFIAGEFKCDCYLLGYSETMVCSLESILNIPIEYKYEFIIIDECESCFKQFSSSTLKNHIDAFNRLDTYIKMAKKVIFADAFITQRTIDYCKSFNEPITMIKNSVSIQRKTAFQLEDSLSLQKLMIVALGNNQNIYTCFSRRKTILEIKSTIENHAPAYNISPDIIDKSLFYFGNDDDKNSIELKDINKNWSKKQLIATTPTITVGCSFSPETDKENPHFEAVYVDAFPSCSVRDTFQQIMRVRNTKTNTLYFTLPNAQTQNIIKNANTLIFDIFKNYEQHFSNKLNLYIGMFDNIILKKKNRLEDFTDILRIKETFIDTAKNTPPALRKILFFNLYETTISNCYYNEMFVEFLKRCDYEYTTTDYEKPSSPIIPEITNEWINFCKKINYEEDGVNIVVETYDDIDNYINGIIEHDPDEKHIPFIRNQLKSKLSLTFIYNQIPTISTQVMEILNKKIKKKQATANDKKQIEKYYFLKTIRTDIVISTDIQATMFYRYWCDTSLRKTYDNARVEKGTYINSLEYNEIASGCMIDILKDLTVKSKIIKNINILLGLNNSFEEDIIITRIQIEQMNDYLTKSRTAILNTFHIRDQSKSKELGFNKNLNLLKQIYFSWSRMSITLNSKHSHTKVPIDYKFGTDNIDKIDIFEYVR